MLALDFFDRWYVDLTGPIGWLLAVWLTFVGGVVGSFLNVVVYRAPRGRSVTYPGSRCPNCGQAIRWYDNFPVLSWVILGARCRHCKTTISVRYPLVEGVVAALFLLLAGVELLSGGANLPALHASPRLVPVSLLLLYAAQLLVLCLLLCDALIEFDGRRIPRRFWGGILLVVVAIGLVTSLVPPLPSGDIVEPLAGLGMGLLLGLIFHGASFWGERWTAFRTSSERGPAGDGTLGLALAACGVVLGWQAVALLATAVAGLHLLTCLIGWAVRGVRRFPRAGMLFLLVLAMIVFFRPLYREVPLMWPENGLLMAAVALPVCFLFSFLAAAVQPAHSSSTLLEGAMHDANEPRDSIEPVDPQENLRRILNSPSYRIAAYDGEFLCRQELRPVRLQLELLKPEMAFLEQGVRSTIVVFGGTHLVEESEARRLVSEARARLDVANDASRQRDLRRAERILAKAKYYDAARQFSRLVSSYNQTAGHYEYVIVTGGGPGIMEAANRGAYDVQAKSIGLNITLPAEQRPNPYITPELCFQFHYFALRKMHFLMRAKALVVFPGGFGTLDELFDALTLRQTERMQEIPIILFAKQYWDRVIDFQFLADEGVIADAHLDLIQYAETPEEAWQIIYHFHQDRAT